jgi:hypothetical protein
MKYKEITALLGLENINDKEFDVLVFIPSKDEDESRITCGNAVLSQLQQE